MPDEVRNIEDKIGYPNDIRDCLQKIRAQLELGFPANRETEVLLEFLDDEIREPIMRQIEKVQEEKKRIYREGYNELLIKYGKQQIQYGKPCTIGETFRQMAEEGKELKNGTYTEEKLTPEMFKQTPRVWREYSLAKMQADNYINSKIMHIVITRLKECGLLLNYEVETNI